ncbi:MAG TPA: prepilin-type N-terminal cleavage/methylation domain-containing protein [Epulopiscium sp.]|nr:prepilin-type N-terminal cleavage/methylation domain-containing protein [Candidatus Epulonipiscium sp.]
MIEKTKYERYEKGFTLIELIIVIAIFGIISAVLVPSFLETRRRVKKKVCSMNCLKVEEMYETYLYEGGKEHSGIIFNQHIEEEDKDMCPDAGLVIYEGGKVKCSVHSLDKDDGKEDVPYL